MSAQLWNILKWLKLGQGIFAFRQGKHWEFVNTILVGPCMARQNVTERDGIKDCLPFNEKRTPRLEKQLFPMSNSDGGGR